MARLSKREQVMTHPNTPELDKLDGILADYYWACEYDGTNGYKTQDEAKAALTRLLAKRELEGRIGELKQLADFLKSAHLYDQDSAMKLRYHFGKRLAELREELAKYE